MPSYVPDRVKRDYRRFPRVVLADGTDTERLTPLITQHQTTGDVAGVVLESITPSQRIRMGDYELNIQPNRMTGSAAATTPEPLTL